VSADPRLERVIGAIMARGVNYSAADVYDGFARLNELSGSGRVELAKVGILRLPPRQILLGLVKSCLIE
jgi:hypothetical protein